MQRVERKNARLENFNQLVMLQAWGAVLVVASFILLFLGRWVDVQFNTQPFLMLGMFILGIFLVFGRLYKESSKIKDAMGLGPKHHA